MKHIIIGIGGGHSGAGKTTMACEILKKVEGWGAIKFTKTSFYSSITDDQEVLSAKGKDTGRLLEAGAERVLGMADIVITDEESPQGVPERAERFYTADIERCMHYLLEHIKKGFITE